MGEDPAPDNSPPTIDDIPTFTLPPPVLLPLQDPDCDAIMQDILEAYGELIKRAFDLRVDALDLPPTGKMSIQGHVDKFYDTQRQGRKSMALWDKYNCGPGLPDGVWKYFTMKAPRRIEAMHNAYGPQKITANNSLATASRTVVIVGSTVGIVYVTYRVIRMIPSVVFPPLWPTIVPNAVIP